MVGQASRTEVKLLPTTKFLFVAANENPPAGTFKEIGATDKKW